MEETPFCLKHLLASDVRCLEYYKDKSWRSGKHDPKGVLHFILALMLPRYTILSENLFLMSKPWNILFALLPVRWTR